MSTTPGNSVGTLNRHTLLAQVVSGVAATNSQFAALLKPGITAHPILYFGDPTTAQIATFGVNPSADEFARGRWPTTVTFPQLDSRLVNYFNNPSAPPHRWFDGYDDPATNGKALNLLGYSYRSNAVHLDLSPRATRAMRSADRALFLQMVSGDMRWFLSLLVLCPNLKAAIMSGSVTNAHYIDEFLCKYLPTGYDLKLRIPFSAGRGATALYDLSGPGFSFPVFFCGTSPSGDKGVRLATEVGKAMPHLKAAGF
jgi:hypothetical protein